MKVSQKNKNVRIKIAPSILSADFSRLKEEIEKIEKAGADSIHVDVMDGHFVPNITIGPVVLECIRKVTNLPLDVHLMISEPEKYIDIFAKAGADFIYAHFESSIHLHRLISMIKENGKKSAVAINPATPIEMVFPVLSEIDRILIMSVNPGFGGQKFIPACLEKISKMRRKIDSTCPGKELEVDGGINPETATIVVKAGATHIVAGNYVFKSGNVEKSMENLRKAVSIKF